MKIKTSELTGAALDWAVATCEGEDYSPVTTYSGIGAEFPPTNYSTDWAQGGPIIERESIGVTKGNPLYFPKGNEKGDYYEDLWIARKTQEHLPPGMRGVYEKWGTTPLIAAMRCYVASKLGDEVDVPDEILRDAELDHLIYDRGDE